MLYTTRCSICGFVFDMNMSMNDYIDKTNNGDLKYTCPSCNKSMHPIRVLSSTPVIYKTDGFYSVDSRSDKDVNPSRSS